MCAGKNVPNAGCVSKNTRGLIQTNRKRNPAATLRAILLLHAVPVYGSVSVFNSLQSKTVFFKCVHRRIWRELNPNENKSPTKIRNQFFEPAHQWNCCTLILPYLPMVPYTCSCSLACMSINYVCMCDGKCASLDF